MSRLLFALLAGLAFGHGMDKPGPHGGFIRMPGRFHTEIKEDPDKGLLVYLLDEEFHKPLTAGSWVKGAVKRNETRVELECAVQADKLHFQCRLPVGFTLKEGDKVILNVQRKGTPPGTATYGYPFKLLKG